ncbi:phage tail tape measure protein [Bacillus cytotoxicus]|uniref:phage tail tape measure protein n=1 Tax=Bacillus cytotoxicus TaxID=580165 RepID=UPI001AEED22C|nr:phage tail tape measure protein [Bacillus cytotoxicus]QTR78348.1 phage tail tape measure protein [Bacillus cytotoxicus]
MQNGFKHITRTLREFQQAASQPINIPTPNMSGWNSAMQSASQQVRQMNDRMRNMTPPPPPNMNGWNSTFRNVGNRVQEMGHRVQQAGHTAQNAFAPAAAASGFFLGKMINDAREFESQTRRAAVLTGGSYNQVKSDILDMAKTSVYSTREVAAAYSEMGAKGFDAAQSTAALPGVLSAAAASGEDLGLVADTITSALNAFGMEANKSGKVADILAQSANQSAASVLDLNYAFKYAAGPANALGISMEELAASIGIMVDAGSTGESAGTALRASMLRLVKPPKEAADALKKLGVTTTDSNGKMKPLAQLMGELQKGMEGYTDSQKASTMAAIFGTEAVSGMLNLMGAGPEKIREMTKALKNSSGASKQAADDMLKGWAGALKMMESAIDTNSKTFVDALGPAIEAVANSITNLVNWFANLSGTMRSVVAISAVSVTGFLVIATVVGMMASAIGTALIPLGKFIGWLGKSTTAAKLASAAMVGLRAAFAFLTGPVGIVIAALALIGVAILQLYKHNETFRNGVNSAWESVKSVTVSAVETMKSAFDAFCAYLSTIPAKFSEMGVAIGGFVDSVKEKFSGIGENISAAFGSTIESLSAKFAGISSALSPVVEFIKSSFASISNTIATLTPLVVRLGLSFLGISGPVGWVIAIIASLGATLFKLINSNEQAKAALTSAWQMIQNVISTVAATLMPILTSIAQGFIDAFAPLAPEFEKTGQVIAESLATLGPVLAELGAAFGELGTTIASLFGEVVQAVMPLALELIQLFADTTIEIMPVITEAIQQVAQIFTEFAATYLPMFVQAFQQGFPIVLQVIQTVFEIAGMLIQGFGEIIMIVATTVIPLILQVVQAVFPVVVSIIQAAIPVASAILQGIATIIKGVVIPAIQFILSIVQAVFPSVVSVITSAINIITNIIKLFTSLLKGDWSGAWNAVKGITSSAMSLIRSIIQGAISLISSIVTAGLNLVRSVFSSVLSSVYSTVTSIFNNVKSFLSGIDLGSIGRNMMQGLLNGISSMASAIWNKITEIGNGIKDKISGLLSIHSPSRWFRDFIGVNMMKGWINGIDAMKGAVQKTTERMAEWMKPEALTVETVYGMPKGLGTYRTAKTTPIIDAVNKSNLQPGQSSNSKQPAYINVQIGKQEFVRFVDDITNEQKIAKERRAIF